MTAKGASGQPDPYRKARHRMVAEQLIERGITDRRVIDAFLKVPRHLFVPPDRQDESYEDHPIHIGAGQTISQPYMVALMTEALGLSGGERVLEIGTGSGYQTAILAELAAKVYTIERIPELAARAEETLTRLGVANVHFKVADGTLGWPEFAPYDAILAAAAAPSVPTSLEDQLAPGGRLAIPVGSTFSQMLTLVTRTEEGFVSRDVCPCIFVKLIGREGYKGS